MDWGINWGCWVWKNVWFVVATFNFSRRYHSKKTTSLEQLWMYWLTNDMCRAVRSLSFCLQPWLLLCLLRLTMTLHHPPGHTTCKCTQVLIPLERPRWGSSRCISLWWCPLAGILEVVELYLECKWLSTKSTVTQPSYQVTSCTTLWKTPRFVLATSSVDKLVWRVAQ